MVVVVVVVVVVDKDYSLTSQRRVARSHCFPGAPAWVVGQTRTLYRPAPKDTHHACARVEMDEGGVGGAFRPAMQKISAVTDAPCTSPS